MALPESMDLVISESPFESSIVYRVTDTATCDWLSMTSRMMGLHGSLALSSPFLLASYSDRKGPSKEGR